jgi:hypothetical protein
LKVQTLYSSCGTTEADKGSIEEAPGAHYGQSDRRRSGLRHQ